MNEVFFLQVHMKKNKKKNFKPKVNMYVYGFKKLYHGDINLKSLHNWIGNIVKAMPTPNKTIKEIESIDSYYFMHIYEKWLNANKIHLTVLAKLISPLNIHYG